MVVFMLLETMAVSKLTKEELMSIWIEDADKIAFDDEFEKLIYSTDKIKEFLEEKQLGICANKGIGKTFLLKCKRKQQQQSGMFCLPEGSLVDSFCRIEIAHELRTFFDDYYNWRNLWSMSIFFAIAKNWNGFKIDISEFSSGEIFSSIASSETLKVSKFSVSSVMAFLLFKKRRELEPLLVETAKYLQLLKQVHSAMAIFLDKVDQAFSRELTEDDEPEFKKGGNRNVLRWKFAQISILETAYEIFTINNHIKIHYAIRPECFIGIEMGSDTIKNARTLLLTTLAYTEFEIKLMLEHYIKRERDDDLACPKAKDIIERLVGVKQRKHPFLGIYEENFQYIYRHTIGTPRDLMIIGKQFFISRNEIREETDVSKREKIFRDIIHYLSDDLLKYYIEELKHLGGLSIDEFELMAKQFNFNVFNERYVKYILRNFVKDYSKKHQDCDMSLNKAKNILLRFFSLGIMGYSVQTGERSMDIQFQNFAYGAKSLTYIPKAKFLFLHSSLNDFANNYRIQNGLSWSEPCKNVLVAPKQSIELERVEAIKKSIKLHIAKLPKLKVFVSSTCLDLEKERELIRNVIKEAGYEPVMSNYFDKSFVKSGVHMHDACIDAIEDSDKVIFIQGKRYGSPYDGKKYKDLFDKIKSENLREPSITLLEFARALELKKTIFKFVHHDIQLEKQIFKKGNVGTEFIPQSVDTKEVFHVIDYITKNEYGVNNFITEYFTLNSLIEKISEYLED
jgi:hypothetical protein